MRTLLCLITMGLLTAQDLPNGGSQLPIIKKPFAIDYLDLPNPDTSHYMGKVLIEFEIDKKGKVVLPEIIDSFNVELNDAIIDRVMAIEFKPALQNGKPVRVRYKLPILFK